MGKPDLSDYVEVSERILHFREAYPEGTLQSEIVSMTETIVVVKAYAYRAADDERPGTGLASEPIPGATSFTRNSELMNAETSAWGRAIIAVGASDAKRVASADEVRNRTVSEDDMGTLEEWIGAAQAKGISTDWVKLRAYASKSPENLVKAIDRLRSEVEQ